jgi:hypothetical protein
MVVQPIVAGGTSVAAAKNNATLHFIVFLKNRLLVG